VLDSLLVVEVAGVGVAWFGRHPAALPAIGAVYDSAPGERWPAADAVCQDGSVQKDLSRTVKAETGPVALFLLELFSQDPNPNYLEAARRGLAFLEKDVIPKRQWYDYETFWSCSPRQGELDERTQQWPANNLALGQTVEAYLLAHRATGEARYLAQGEALLDYLLMFQQCWTHPGLEKLSGETMLLGGFTTQNSDAEWSDARQSQCGNFLLDYYRATGKAEYLARGVAALRAQFPISPSENWAHSGYAKAGVSSFHWGTGSGMAGIEIEEDYLRDAIVDVAAGCGIGVNGLNLTACAVKEEEIRFRLSSPFAWKRSPVVVFRHTNPSQQYRVEINEAEVGTWEGKELEKGIKVALQNAAQTPPLETTGKAEMAKQPVFPLRVSENRRHFVSADGKPFPVIGDSSWSLIAQLGEEAVVRYLDDRRARGFNSILVNLIEHKFASKAPAKIDGVAPFLKASDFAQPNPTYFDYAHHVVEVAKQRGFAVWLCAAYLGWNGGDEGFFKEIKAGGRAALGSYGRFVGERFKDLPNIVWVIGGDYAVPETERWVGNELALGLREGGATQLMTSHGGQTSGIDTFGEQPWLTVETVYHYQTDLWRPLLAAYGRRPTRPYVLIETVYEGEHDSKPQQIRRQAWWAMLCGAGGQFFGNNPMWHFDGPTLFPHTETWEQALDSTGAADIGRLARFLGTHRWDQLIPDAEGKLVTDGAGDGPTRIIAATASDGSVAVFYIPAEGTEPRKLTLDLAGFPCPMKVGWFNPAKDASVSTDGPSLQNRAQQHLQTPGDNGAGVNDWVLVLEALTK
jgi:hypothetical protein